MKHRMRYVVTLFTASLLLAVAAPAASALRIRDARIKNGAVEIRGKDAKSNATITIDGQPAGFSTKRGSFKITTTDLPADCVADVSDGVDTRRGGYQVLRASRTAWRASTATRLSATHLRGHRARWHT